MTESINRKATKKNTLQPDNLAEIRFGRPVYHKDSYGNYTKDPLIEFVENGFSPKEVEDDIIEEINRQTQKPVKAVLQKNSLLADSLSSLSAESLTADNIDMISANYTPNPFPLQLGADARFHFRACFKNTLPPSYKVRIDLTLDSTIKVTETKDFSTDGFVYNPTTQRYEKYTFDEVRIASTAIEQAFNAQTLVSPLNVYYTFIEETTPSQKTVKVCSGLMPKNPISNQSEPCDCCQDCDCTEWIQICETSITTKSCREEPTCSTSDCEGGSCGSGSKSGNYNGLKYLKGNVKAGASIREGYFKLLATQLQDGNHELYLYYSSANALDISTWFFNFGECLVEDPVDSSILTRFNPQIGSMRFVYSSASGYTPYLSSFKGSLLKDSVTKRVILTYPDGSSSVYYYPESTDPNIPVVYRLAGKRDSNGKLIQQFEDWWAGLWPLKITDDLGRMLNGVCQADSESRHLVYTDWLGRKYTYLFDVTYHRLRSYTDPSGNILSMEYDPMLLLEFLGPRTISYNGELQASFSSFGAHMPVQLGKAEYPDGTVFDYDYNFTSGIIAETISKGQTIGNAEYTFNDNGKLLTTTDVTGKTTSRTYDDNGRVTSMTAYACGIGTEEYTYYERGNILTYTDAMDNVTRYEYGDTHNPDKATKITGPAPFLYETTFTYDPDNGWLLTMTDPLGRTMEYTYYTEGSKKGLKHTEEDYLGHITEYDYDDNKNISWIKDYLERYAYFWYDNDGRLHREQNVYGDTVQYYYGSGGGADGKPVMVISVRDGKEDITRFEYDSLGRTSVITGGDGLTVRYGYDSDGNTIITTDSLGNSSRMEYNQNGRIIRQVDAKGYITSYEYDDYSNLTKIIDPMLRERTYQYDPLTGKMTGMTDPMGRSTQYSCNDYCATKTITDPNNWTTKYYYDVKCQLTKIEYHDGSFYQFGYDSLGRKISETGGAGGQETIFGSVKYSSGGEEYNEAEYGTFKYGADTPLYGFDPDLTTICYSYDAAGRLTKISYPAPPDAPLLPDGTRQRKDISYEYYADDKIKKITDAAGYDRVYDYDNQNRLISITIDGKTVTYHYDDTHYGRLDYIMLPNGVKKEYVYGECSKYSVKYVQNQTSNLLYQFDYGFDKKGNLTQKAITNPSEIKTVFNFSYDSLNRLINLMENSRQVSQFDYDPNGNLIKDYRDDEIIHFEYDTSNRIINQNGISYKYDLNSNLIEIDNPAEGKSVNVYDYGNRLLSTKYPDKTSDFSLYNSSGLLFCKTERNKDKHYYYRDYHSKEVLNTFDNTGKLQEIILPDIGCKSIFNQDKWIYYVTGSGIFAILNESGLTSKEFTYNKGSELYSELIDEYARKSQRVFNKQPDLKIYKQLIPPNHQKTPLNPPYFECFIATIVDAEKHHISYILQTTCEVPLTVLSHTINLYDKRSTLNPIKQYIDNSEENQANALTWGVFDNLKCEGYRVSLLSYQQKTGYKPNARMATVNYFVYFNSDGTIEIEKKPMTTEEF
jgi:YD repeat-containing protein